MSGGNYFRGKFCGAEAIVPGTVLIGGNCPGGNHPGGNHPGGNCPEANYLGGGNCPDTMNLYYTNIYNSDK